MKSHWSGDCPSGFFRLYCAYQLTITTAGSGPQSAIFFTRWAAFPIFQREPVFVGELPGPIDTTGDTTPVVIVHPCDPDSVYFEQQVLPILASNCAMSGCHDVQSHKEGVILTSYDKVKSTGGINLSNPSNSKIYKSLNESGEDRMRRRQVQN